MVLAKDETSIAVKEESYNFIISLATILAKCGATVYETEEVLAVMADFLDIKGNYVILNNVLLVTTDSDKKKRASMSILPHGNTIINKLEAVSNVVQLVLNGEIDVKTGKERLEKIENELPVFGKIIEYLSWPLMAGGFAGFFGGGVKECLVAAFISSILYFINACFAKVENIEHRRMFEPIAAGTSSVLAILSAFFIPPLSVAITTLSGLMMLMPGLALTRSLNEIALGHTMSGISRFLNALTILLLMSTGVFVSSKIDHLLSLTSQYYSPAEQELWLILICIIVATYACCVCAKVKHKHFIGVLMVAVVISLILIWGSNYLGPSLATGIASVITALSANLYSRWQKCSDSTIKVPNAFILVPGAMGFSALVLLINNEILQGIDKLITTFGVGIAIIAGFIISDIICPPHKLWRKEKKSTH